MNATSDEQIRWSYRPGTWFGVVGEHVGIIVPSSAKDRVAALWEATDDAAEFDAVLDTLVAGGLSGLPAFALIGLGETTRLLIRGTAISASVETAAGTEHVDGSSAGTWVERSFDGAVSVEVSAEDSPSGFQDLALPAGLVRLGRINHPAVVVPAAVASTDGVAPQVVAAVVPDAPADDWLSPGVAVAEPDVPPSDVDDSAESDPDQPEVAQAPFGLSAVPEIDQGPEPELAAVQEADPGAETEMFPAVGAADADDDPDSGDAPGAVAPQIPDPSDLPPPPDFPPPPPPPSVPPAAAPTTPPPAYAPPAPEAPQFPASESAEAEADLGVDTEPDDHDGLTRFGSDGEEFAREQPGIPGQPPPPSVTRTVARLLISNGETVDVDRVILVGRAPEARRFTSTEQPHLVTVPSRLQEISSTHLEVRPGSGVDHGSAVVTDMGSTNGTVLVQPGLDPEDLKPGIAVQLLPGAVINLGDGVTIQVTRPE